MANFLLVMTGGAIGAAMRYALGLFLPPAGPAGWPVATFLANIGGGLAMGVLAAALLRHGPSEPLRLFAGVGLLGGFTTFSAFSLETMAMIDASRWTAALSYAGFSVVGSVAALALGMALVRAL